MWCFDLENIACMETIITSWFRHFLIIIRFSLAVPNPISPPAGHQEPSRDSKHTRINQPEPQHQFYQPHRNQLHRRYTSNYEA